MSHKPATPVPTSVVGQKAFLDCTVHHLQGPHASLAGRRLRLSVTFPDLSADAVAGDFLVPDDVSSSLAQVCPSVPSADKGLVLSSIRGPIAVDMRPPESMLHKALDFSSSALSLALANNGMVVIARLRVSVVHVGGEGDMTELVSTGATTVDLRRLIMEDKVTGCRVATSVGQIGVMLSVSASDRDGFKRRLEHFLATYASPSGSTPAEQRASQMLQHDHVNEAFVFLQLRQRFQGVSVKERFNAFAQLYRLPPGQLMEMLAKWARHELRALAMLTMAVGPEGGDIDMLTRLTQYTMSQDLDHYETLRWLAGEHFPAAKALTDERLEEKCDTFFPTPASRDASMARLVAKHGPEAPPTMYLFRQGLAITPKLELCKASPNSVSLARLAPHSPTGTPANSVSFRSNVPTTVGSGSPGPQRSPRGGGGGGAAAETTAATTPTKAPLGEIPPGLARTGTMEPPMVVEEDGGTSSSSSSSPSRSPVGRMGAGGLQKGRSFAGGSRSKDDELRAKRKASISKKAGLWNPNQFLNASDSDEDTDGEEQLQPPPPAAPAAAAAAVLQSRDTTTTASRAPDESRRTEATEPTVAVAALKPAAAQVTGSASPSQALSEVEPTRPPVQKAPQPSARAPSSPPATSVKPDAASPFAAAATPHDRRRAAAAARGLASQQQQQQHQHQQPPRIHTAASVGASVATVRTSDEAIQTDLGKAPPVIVAVPSGLPSTSIPSADAAATAAERVWSAVLRSASELCFSEAFLLTSEEAGIAHLMKHDAMKAKLPAKTTAEEAVAAVVARRRTLLQHCTELRPAPASEPLVAQAASAFAALTNDPRDEHPHFETHLALVVRNSLLDDAHARHISLQRSHAAQEKPPGKGSTAPSAEGSKEEDVVRCFAWCSDMASAVDAATHGVPATAAVPFVFRKPAELRRAATSNGSRAPPGARNMLGVSSLGEAPPPRVWGSHAPSSASRAAGSSHFATNSGGHSQATTGSLLVCDVFVGSAYRTVMSAVPSGVTLRADVDGPLRCNSDVQLDADGTGVWTGAHGAVYDSAILRHGAPGESLAIFSPQQVRVRAILTGVWANRARVTSPPQATQLRARGSSSSATPTLSFAPRHVDDASSMASRTLFLPDATFGPDAALHNSATAAEEARSTNTAAVRRRPGTWSHLGDAASVSQGATIPPSSQQRLGGLVAAGSPPPQKPEDDGAKAVRLEVARGFRLFRSGQLDTAAEVWTHVATSGCPESATYGLPESELSDAERCARLEALGILHESVERDVRAAETAYRSALDREPNCSSVLFRLGSLMETALHEHGAALALFDQAANLGDPAAARRGQLLRRRMSMHS